MYSFLSHTTTAPPLSAGFMTMSSLLWRLIKAADSSGARLDFFRWFELVSYFSQTLAEGALNLGVGTVRRFSVDRSLKQSNKNIVRITLTFWRMTKDCHPSQRAKKKKNTVDSHG